MTPKNVRNFTFTVPMRDGNDAPARLRRGELQWMDEVNARKARAIKNREVRLAAADALAHLAPKGHAAPFLNRAQERLFRRHNRRTEV